MTLRFSAFLQKTIAGLCVGVCALLFALFTPHIVHAQIEDGEPAPEAVLFDEGIDDVTHMPPNEFYRAKVVEIIDERTVEEYGYTEETQEIRVRILHGTEEGEEQVLFHGGVVSIDEYQKVDVGDVVALLKTYRVDGTHTYYISDHYRLGPLLFILLLFAGLVIFFGRWKGVGSLFGLAFSILVLAKYIVPQIISGKDPLVVTLVGVFVIATISLYLAHGFTKRTSVALLSTFITLAIAFVISHIFVDFAYLFGRGSEEAYFLQFSESAAINLRGLLLAGITIGTLGVLDDITTAQTAVVGELRQANQKLRPRELYNRALVVGREHISSLVNTLVLAYAGASLPLFILFTVNDHVPFWMKMNSEIVVEELMRTIIGSTALILAVPISTLLATYFLQNEKVREGEAPHVHIH